MPHTVALPPLLEGIMSPRHHTLPALSEEALTDPRRLLTLRRTTLLDSPPTDVFDRFTRLAVTILRVPMALLTLVDVDRQFFVSQVGLPEPWASARQTPLSHSFCRYVVVTGERLLIADARVHPLFKDNRAIADFGIVAYAGIPLRTYDGAVLGAFCAAAHRPHTWRRREIEILHELAAAVTTDIELQLCR